MIVNKDYILSRIKTLTKNNASVHNNEQNSVAKILKIKYALPKWLRQLIFSSFNPVFSISKQRILEKKGRNAIRVIPGIISTGIALNFILDSLLENVKMEFDTSLFYPNQDEEIINFIDNRVKCAFSGFEYVPRSAEAKNDKENQIQIREMVKKSGREYYSLVMDKSKYYLPGDFFTSYVFLYHYGLKYFPFFSGYIENKVFLDIGAYCGDTSLIFTRYNPSVIYAYEPVSRNYSLLEATVKKNLLKDKVIPLKKGLGDEKGVFYINISGPSSSLNTNVQNNANMEAVEVSTLDDECEGRQIGLIKMDVEGFEFNVIKGGLKTICRDKPVMIISIYHTAKDFFEIPPMILSACPDYRLKYLDLKPSDLIEEKVLVCYPSDLTSGQK